MEQNIPKLSVEETKKKSLLLPVLLILLVLLVGILACIVLKQRSDIERLQHLKETYSTEKQDDNEKSMVDKNDKTNNEKDQTNQEEIATTKEYVLPNPKLKFTYPSNYTVTSSTDSEFVIVKVITKDSYLEMKMFEAVGGPGGPTAYETTNLGTTKIGQIFGKDIYRVQTDSSSYIYTIEPTKCIEKTKCDIYEPECTCKNIENYIVNSTLPTDLVWSPSKNGKTYISFSISGKPSQEDLKNYDNLILSLEVE